MSVLQASLVAVAAIGSNPRLDIDSSYDIVNESKLSLVRMAFPYIREDKSEKQMSKAEIYDKYFDELDAIEEKEKNERKEDGVTDQLALNGGNDIIDKEK